MEVGCELEVDVNGEETFMVDKKVIACFSGRFRKLFGKLRGSNTRRLKVIFQDFPGGADGFELVTRFCYNNGMVEITPSNIVLLNRAAYFMEMSRNNNSSEKANLLDLTEKYLEGINYWTWSELLIAMKQCKDLFPQTNSSIVCEKVVDSIIARLSWPTVASPFTCSSDNFSSQFSSDISSTCSTRFNGSLATWWFEDLLFLNADWFRKAIRLMVTQKLEHAAIFKFLIFYLKSGLPVVSMSEKCQLVEAAISMLSLLDRTCLSFKGLFEILRIVSSLKRISKSCKFKLEKLIGLKLDQATLDHLLVRSPRMKDCAYDVNLILRLVEGYLLKGCMISSRLKKVASLMDSYLIEVASDALLKPSKFAELLLVLPCSARESNDKLYQAIDLYFEVHTQLSQEEKMRLCCALNQDKLSAETLKHLSQNSKFPSKAANHVFITQHSKHSRFYSDKATNDIPFCSKTRVSASSTTEGINLVVPLEKTELQRMQRRVVELEKFCIMDSHSQMPNATKRESGNQGKVRSLPKLCSC